MNSQMLMEAMDAPNRVRELLSSDQNVYEALGRQLRELDPDVVATIARGSSDHAANYAAYLIPLCTGRLVASLPPSICTVLQSRLRLRGQFVLAISQSGGSPDLLRALRDSREGGALTAALVNVAGSPLAQVAEVELPQRAGSEVSITATKTVLCTLTAIARLTAEWAQDDALLKALPALPEALSLAAEAGSAIDDSLLKGIDHAFVISRALGYGSATELALKFKETCGVHAEAFSTAEVRHGPREIVNKEYLVLAIALPGSGEADVIAAAEELRGQGARVIVVGRSEIGADLVLPPLPDFRLAPLLALQMLYPWIARSAKRLGRDPDKPKTLASKVIQTV